MSLSIADYTDLRELNTLRLPARARWYCEPRSCADLLTALDFARERALRTLVLGGGSNVVLRGEFPGLVLRIGLRGEELLEQSAARVVVRVAAGEAWHDFVLSAHARGWYGLENLALIPGTVGAAPIQNIGAYGVELARFVREVTVVDRASGQQHVIDRAGCEFRYRDSVFKRAAAERLVITDVTFDLPQGEAPCVSYAALAAELPDAARATPAQLLEAVMRLRRQKLPDPALLPNAGSFFKNPVVSAEQCRDIIGRDPHIVHYPLADGSCKLAAGWMIEACGWKGKCVGRAGVYDRQALVLVNRGGATGAEGVTLARAIQESVYGRFGIRLEPEPVVV